MLPSVSPAEVLQSSIHRATNWPGKISGDTRIQLQLVWRCPQS